MNVSWKTCRQLRLGYAETRRKQLVEIKGRKADRKLTRRIIIECILVE